MTDNPRDLLNQFWHRSNIIEMIRYTIINLLGISAQQIEASLNQLLFLLYCCANVIIFLILISIDRSIISVYWFPAASDLSVEVDKTITEHVLTELRRRNLNVVACSFDGKSHLRVSTGMKGEPQTYMQVVRNHWDECKKVKTVQELIDVTAEETGEVKRLSLLCLLRIHRLR